uniref:glutaminyl-peptide cyclotransferase n=1 Tax=Megaselia scalaris TaxID=36166 RepID=T1GMG1_MEGSC
MVWFSMFCLLKILPTHENFLSVGYQIITELFDVVIGDVILAMLSNGPNPPTPHRSRPISNEHLKSINDLSDIGKFKETLEPILVPRIVGTPNHEKVRNYIVDEMKRLNWSVELDTFDDKTPNFGTKTFHNIIAKLNPNAKSFLTLACHYDSKYIKDVEFVGAIDSAVPCAMLLHMAERLNGYFESSKTSDLSLMFVFFDGEEAFQEWGPEDSIYGARHLASRWNSENFFQK